MKSPVSFDFPNVFSMVEQAFRLFPGQTAIVFNEDAISYAELEVRVANRRELIKSKVPNEQLIAVSCTRSIDTVVNILALLSAEKAYLPIDFDLPEERLLKIVAEASLRYGLTGNSEESFASLNVTDINEIPGRSRHMSCSRPGLLELPRGFPSRIPL
jgi:non-ribosomal peptide synthetase component F